MISRNNVISECLLLYFGPGHKNCKCLTYKVKKKVQYWLQNDKIFIWKLTWFEVSKGTNNRKKVFRENTDKNMDA